MDIVVAKLALTPGLILLASLAVRRWGASVGGWLVGLPLTSGPVSFFLAIEHGTQFAASAAAGSIAGTTAEACFAVAYSAVARFGIVAGMAAGSAAFLLSGWLLQGMTRGLLPLYAIAAASLALGARLIPRRPHSTAPLRAAQRFDLPARMLVGTVIVISITAAAPTLGPRLSGLIASYPVFATVLTVFAHRQFGVDAVRQTFFGLLLGLYAFGTFFLVLGLSIVPLGIAGGFAAAAAAGVLVQGGSLWLMRRPVSGRLVATKHP